MIEGQQTQNTVSDVLRKRKSRASISSSSTVNAGQCAMVLELGAVASVGGARVRPSALILLAVPAFRRRFPCCYPYLDARSASDAWHQAQRESGERRSSFGERRDGRIPDPRVVSGLLAVPLVLGARRRAGAQCKGFQCRTISCAVRDPNCPSHWGTTLRDNHVRRASR